MRHSIKLAAATASIAFMTTAMAAPVSAGCQRLGFTVNDYGKEGPTKDAKSLLDKLIAKKMAERGIAKYTTGTKSVSCELFLNFIVFDEHTCTAEATVCWDGSPLPKGETTATADPKAKPADAKPAATKATLKTTSAKPAAAKTAEPAQSADTAPAAETAKAADAPAQAPAPEPAADAPNPAAQ